jgi:hypothetical protein
MRAANHQASERGEVSESNLTEGEPWSRMALCDLTNGLALGQPVEEIADFLCRSEKEVREKIIELEPAKDADRK